MENKIKDIDLKLNKIDNSLIYYGNVLDFENTIYNLTFMFDNLEDLRKHIKKDYSLTADLFNKGVDSYNSLLDFKKMLLKENNKNTSKEISKDNIGGLLEDFIKFCIELKKGQKFGVGNFHIQKYLDSRKFV